MSAAALRRLREIAEEQRRLAAEAEAALRRAEAQERAAAVLDALDLYDGAPTARASALAHDLDDYLSRAWLRERDLEILPLSATPKRCALHRIARSRDGESIGWRRIYEIFANSQICSRRSSTLQNIPGEDLKMI